MGFQILSESYGRRLPKITAEADSTDDLATLGTNYAEGSTCVIGDKTYSLDKVQGWVEPGSGGGGGGGGGSLVVRTEYVSGDSGQRRFTETAGTIINALRNGVCVVLDETKGTGDFGPQGNIGIMKYVTIYEDNATFYSVDGNYFFYANSPNEYPLEDMG